MRLPGNRMKRGTEACPIKQVPAGEIERNVIDQIRSLLQTPEVVVQTWRAARKADKDITENDVRGALLEFEPIWNELFPAEQARIVELLVERVDLQPGGIDLRLRIEGLTSLCSELRTSCGSPSTATASTSRAVESLSITAPAGAADSIRCAIPTCSPIAV